MGRGGVVVIGVLPVARLVWLVVCRGGRTRRPTIPGCVSGSWRSGLCECTRTV